jgi:hypothetical protein
MGVLNCREVFVLTAYLPFTSQGLDWRRAPGKAFKGRAINFIYFWVSKKKKEKEKRKKETHGVGKAKKNKNKWKKTKE